MKKDNLNKLILKFPQLDFSNFVYIGYHGKGEVKCKNCNETFYDSYAALLQRNNGCRFCAPDSERHRYNLERLVQKLKGIHKDKYDYSKVVLKKQLEKIEIICKDHGSFFMTINNHLRGQGCSKCVSEKLKKKFLMNSIDFFNKCKEVHKNYYNYSQAVYSGMWNKITILCPKHGAFDQIAKIHYDGFGCPRCSSSKGERKISEFLIEKNIKYISQKTFKDCYYKSNKAKLKFDFYLPENNCCIEFDGIQHFYPIKYWRGKEGLKENIIKDNIKTDFCIKNGIKLIRIPYTEFKDIENILNKDVTNK